MPLMSSVDATGVAVQVSMSALGAAGVWLPPSLGPGQVPYYDRLNAGRLIDKIRALSFSDQAGTLFVEDADNPAGAWTTLNGGGAGTVAAAGALADSAWNIPTKRYWRVRYLNGAVAQTSFELWVATGAGQPDVHTL